jgi:hypothetical protein
MFIAVLWESNLFKPASIKNTTTDLSLPRALFPVLMFVERNLRFVPIALPALKTFYFYSFQPRKRCKFLTSR